MVVSVAAVAIFASGQRLLGLGTGYFAKTGEQKRAIVGASWPLSGQSVLGDPASSSTLPPISAGNSGLPGLGGVLSETALGTVAGRQARYDALLDKPPSVIFSEWSEVIRRSNSNEMSIVAAALGYALQNQSDAGIYVDLGDQITNKANSVTRRMAAIDALMHAATPEAVTQLLRYLRGTEVWSGGEITKDSPDAQVISQAIRALNECSRALVDGKRNWDASSPLLSAWNEISDGTRQDVLRTLSSGITYLGKPDDIDKFVQAVSQLNQASERYKYALGALEQMGSNDSVGVLAAALQRYDSNQSLSRAIVRGLLSIGTADSILHVTLYIDRSVVLDSSWREEINFKLQQSGRSSPAVAKVLAAWKR